MLSNEDGVRGGGVTFSGQKRYEGVRLNVISVTRGWVGGGVQFPGKSIGYVTFELPLITLSLNGTPSQRFFPEYMTKPTALRNT